MWVNITSDQSLTISAGGYFLLSYYSNSSSSALSVKPQAQKSSLSFSNPDIQIELKNPEGEIIDKAYFTKTGGDDFRSRERDCGYSDGGISGNWTDASMSVNLKSSLVKTYATPESPNSLCGARENTTSETPAQTGGGGSSETQSAVSASYPSYQLINEFMVNPEGNDEEGEWIELYNGSYGPIDLSGWFLDDEEGSSSPFQIPQGTVLMPGSHIVFGAPALKLSLKNSSDMVRLLAPDKSVKEIINYADAKENFAYAKKPDGTFVWTELITPGATNDFPDPLKAFRADDVQFVSVLPNPDGQDDGGELITIRNKLNVNIDLAGWKIVNQKEKEFSLDGINIAPMGQYSFDPSDIGLSLVNKADQLSLKDAYGTLIDRINWSEAKSGQLIYRPDFFNDGMGAKAVRVVDGDTFEALIDGDEYKIRLIGVDTPETVNPKTAVEKYGKEASDHLKKLLENQTVTLNFDETKTDVYGRLLAYVYLGGEFINAEIIKNGYGYAYTRFPFKYSDDFTKYEQEARSKKIGIWSDEEVILYIEDVKNNPDETADDEKTDKQPTEGEDDDPRNTDEPICPTEGLIIDSILPNSEKGVSMEYIKVSNISDKPVCLNGWQLDDISDGGSKPFAIKNGAIEPGASRTFRKNETGISLNDSNDCASLINPEGNKADQICYTKTHKNEIFTHDGGDWESKQSKSSAPDSPKKVSTNTSKQPARETAAFEGELKNGSIDGKIAFIYEEGKIMYLQTEEKIIPVSFANSKINVGSAKQMLDLNEPVKIDVRSAGNENQLISISQSAVEEIKSNTDNSDTGFLRSDFKYLIGLFFILTGLFAYKKFKTQD